MELVPPASWSSMSLSTLVSDSVVFSHLFVSNNCPGRLYRCFVDCDAFGGLCLGVPQGIPLLCSSLGIHTWPRFQASVPFLTVRFAIGFFSGVCKMSCLPFTMTVLGPSSSTRLRERVLRVVPVFTDRVGTFSGLGARLFSDGSDILLPRSFRSRHPVLRDRLAATPRRFRPFCGELYSRCLSRER